MRESQIRELNSIKSGMGSRISSDSEPDAKSFIDDFRKLGKFSARSGVPSMSAQR